jgi:hypothetical protein
MALVTEKDLKAVEITTLPHRSLYAEEIHVAECFLGKKDAVGSSPTFGSPRKCRFKPY